MLAQIHRRDFSWGTQKLSYVYIGRKITLRNIIRTPSTFILGGWHLASDNAKSLKYAKAMSHTLRVQRLQQSDVLTHVGKNACNGLDV